MVQIQRNNENETLLIQEKGVIKKVSRKTFFEKHFVDKMLRLRQEEFENIREGVFYFTHFNLQYTDHFVGEVFALPLIVTPGYYNSKTEVLPILCFEDCFVGKCVGVRNNIVYDDLCEEDFKFSVAHIKTVEQLKKAILNRYSQSMPELSTEKIISLGVAITTLKLIGLFKDRVVK